MRRALRDLLTGTGCLFVASSAILFLSPSSYTASVLIQADADAIAQSMRRPDGRATPASDVILDQLGSSEILDRTVDTFGLGAGPPTPRAASQQDAAIAAVRSGLHVARTPVGGVWKVSYRSRRATLTALVLNDLLDGAQAAERAALDRAQKPRRLLQDAVSRTAANTSAGLAEVRSALTSIQAYQSDEQKRLTDLRRTTRRGDADSPSLGMNSSAPSSGAAPDTGLAALEAERAGLVARQAQLSQRYGPRYPMIVDLVAQTSHVKALIEARKRLLTASQTLASDLAVQSADRRARKRETEAAAALASVQTVLLADLTRRLRAVQGQDAAIADQLFQLAPSTPLNLRRLTHAVQPQAPDPSPVRDIALVVALLSATMMAAALTLMLRERRLVTTAGDVQRLFGLPLVATVPNVSPRRFGRAQASGPGQPTDLLLEGRATPFGDAFLAMQQAIGLSPAAGKCLVVAVCSGLPDEGKTTTSTGLARSAALSGCRVVLIDCDGRRQALSRAFGVPAGPGLVEVLGGRARVQDALSLDTRSGARLIAHSATDAVEDLSTGGRLAGLLAELRDEFDIIVLDTGPVLALTEARVVAALADQVVFVARWRRTPAKAAQLALAMLASVEAKVKGVVLTMVEVKSEDARPVGVNRMFTAL